MIVDRTSVLGRESELLGPQSRRRWSLTERVVMVEQTYEPRMKGSVVTRGHGVAASQLFR